MNDDDARSGNAVNMFDRGLLSAAYGYALDAIDASERADIDARLKAASSDMRQNFRRVVKELHETMAVAAAAATTSPPPELRSRILDAITLVQPEQRDNRKWRRLAIAAAAAAVVGIGGAAAIQMTTNQRGSVVDLVLQAPDGRTATVTLAGGTATLTYSHEKDSAVLEFEGVTPPEAGKVYQLWLFKGPPQSAGTVSATDLGSRRVIPDLGAATAFAITVEPLGGSPAPTSAPIAAITLTS